MSSNGHEFDSIRNLAIVLPINNTPYNSKGDHSTSDKIPVDGLRDGMGQLSEFVLRYTVVLLRGLSGG